MKSGLDPGTVNLYFCHVDDIGDTGLAYRYQTLLSDDEKHRWKQFHFPGDQLLYLVARALVRTTLSSFTEYSPRELTFINGPNGKPELFEDSLQSDIRFNLSHTRGLVMLAVTRSFDLGVDVECIDRISRPMEIAGRFFSKSELEGLHTREEERQIRRFFELWTLKESYIKARGLGLSLPLDQFSFHLDSNGPATISFAPGFDDNSQHWNFWRLLPKEGYQAALAVRSPSRSEFNIAIHSAIPLESILPLHLPSY